MRNWKKDRNYRKRKNLDGSFSYIITVDGTDIEVNAEIYKVYATADRQMEYIENDLKRDRVLQDAQGKAVRDANGLPIRLPEREISLDKLIAEDWDYPSSTPSPEEIIFGLEDSEKTELRRCVSLLTVDEQVFINTLFSKGMTEQEYAVKLGVSQQAINKRKRCILKKIKKFWEQGC